MEKVFSSIQPGELKCEYKTNPAGIDEKQPRFSWITECDAANSFQTAYHLLVASSSQNLLLENGDVWNSGKAKSSDSNQIRYEGTPLCSNQTYFWKVRIWNEDDELSSWSNPATFSTGLFEQSEWKAKWISHLYKKQRSEFSFQPGIDKWIWYPFHDSDDKFKTISLLKSFQIKQVDFIESANLLVTSDEKFQLFLNNTVIAESDDKIFSWARPILIDVKKILKEGSNDLRALGLNTYVEKPGFILRLEIKFKSGKADFYSF